MPAPINKKQHAANRPAHVEPPGRSQRFQALREAHGRAAEAGHAPAQPTLGPRLQGRRLGKGKPTE
jgi:hypothetical protein